MPELETHILALAAEMANSEERAVEWFRSQPIPGWGKTAQELALEGKGERVLEYLYSVRAAVFA